MKRTSILVILSFILLGEVFAQSYDTTTFYGRMNYQFQYLSKTPITTGLLREYGIDYVNLENYNGSTLHDSNWVNLDDWRVLYASLYSQQIVASANNLLYLDTVNRLLNRFSAPGTPINFVVAYYNYQGFDTNAIIKNLITVSNGQLHDVPGRTQSPYITHSIFAVATTSQSIYTGANQMIFRPELLFGNTGKVVSSINVDPFGNGSYQSATLNSPFTINYADTGLYTINIKISYTDGTINLSHTKIAVYTYTGPPLAYNSIHKEPNTGTGPPKFNLEYTDPNSSVRMTADKQYLGAAAQGNVWINYSVNNTSGRIQKPLIFVDGFDPIINDPNFPYSGDNFFYFLDNLNNDKNNLSQITLNHGLDNLNSYDLIYVQWFNGTDYIERNAFLLEKIIAWVNSNKVPYQGVNQQNVIVGLSMGGLVTRYALRDMEINAVAHDTRLFISHDAPQWGANVPPSIQTLVQQVAPWQIPDGIGLTGLTFTDLFPDAINALTLFNSPAAKQMLIQRYILIGNNTLTPDNATHTSFMNEINTMGWPVNCTNLTLSNGGCSGGIQFPNNSSFVSISGSTSLGTYFGNLWRSIAFSLAGGFANSSATRYLPVRGGALIAQFPLGIITTKGSVNLDFSAMGVPSSGISQIYRGNVIIKRQLFWGVFNSTSYLIKCNVNSTSDMLPLDNAPGGNYNIANFGVDIGNINYQLKAKLGSWANISIPQKTFCFVPTVSSLALTNAQTYLNSNVCNSANCLNPAQVKGFYAAQNSTNHITNTQASSDWILIVQSANANCIKLCNTNWSISGPNPLCTSGTYSILNAPTSGVSYAWSVQPTGLASINNNTATTPVLTYQSPGTMALYNTITSCGTSILTSASINVGTVNNLTGTYTNTTTHTTQTANFVPVGSIAGNYQWSGISNISLTHSGTGSWSYSTSNTYGFYLGAGQNLNLNFSGTGTCGVVTATRSFIQSGGGFAIIASPNPASGTLNISITDVTDTTNTSMIQEAATQSQISQGTEFSLYDVNSGALVKQWVYSEAENKIYNINISGITHGVYSLKMSRNNKTVSTKVIIR